MGERQDAAAGFAEELGRPQTNARADQSLLDRVMNNTVETAGSQVGAVVH